MEAIVIRGERCETCRFANVEHDKALACRRFPPSVTTMLVGLDEETGRPLTHQAVSFPPTWPEIWCGEWKSKAAALLS